MTSKTFLTSNIVDVKTFFDVKSFCLTSKHFWTSKHLLTSKSFSWRQNIFWFQTISILQVFRKRFSLKKGHCGKMHTRQNYFRHSPQKKAPAGKCRHGKICFTHSLCFQVLRFFIFVSGKEIWLLINVHISELKKMIRKTPIFRHKIFTMCWCFKKSGTKSTRSLNLTWWELLSWYSAKSI